MKFTFGIFFFLILIAGCRNPSSKPTSDKEEMKLRGPVKYIGEIEYTRTGKYTNYYSFLNSGEILEQSSFNPDGSLIRKWKCQFDPEGRKTTLQCFVKNDSLSYVLHYFYNNRGKISSTYLDQHGVYAKRSDILYNENDEVIKEVIFGMNSGIESQTDYTYAQGKVKEEKHYEKFQNRRWKQIYHFEKSKKTTTYLNDDGLLMNTVIVRMDAKDRMIAEDIYDKKNTLQKSTIYSYNRTGDFSKITVKIPSEALHQTHRYFYQYDQHSNWILLVDSLDNEIDKTLTRKIQYY
jgi:hypothetical protein